MNNLLCKELQRIGCLVFPTGPMDEDATDVMGALFPVTFKVKGIRKQSLELEVIHSEGKDEDAVQKIVASITKVMEEGPIIRAASKIPTDIIDIGGVFGLPTDILERGIIDLWSWNLVAAEKQLLKMMNDVRDYRYEAFLKGELFNGKKTSDYVDDNLKKRYIHAQEMHKTWKGVYGLDPERLDCPMIEDSDIFRLFLTFLAAENACDGSDICNLECDYLKRCICQREHIKIVEPNAAQRLEVGSDFQKWYDYHIGYLLQHDMSWREEVYDAYVRQEDLSRFAPTNDWRGAKAKTKTSPKRTSKSKRS